MRKTYKPNNLRFESYNEEVDLSMLEHLPNFGGFMDGPVDLCDGAPLEAYSRQAATVQDIVCGLAEEQGKVYPLMAFKTTLIHQEKQETRIKYTIRYGVRKP